jgi:hypothetical protein
MKGILCLSFGLVLAAGSATGQVIGFWRSPDTTLGRFIISGGPVRILEPDHMPCLVTDFAKVGRMPVRRDANADPMPNGFRLGRAWSMEIRPGGK